MTKQQDTQFIILDRRIKEYLNEMETEDSKKEKEKEEKEEKKKKRKKKDDEKKLEDAPDWDVEPFSVEDDIDSDLDAEYESSIESDESKD